MDRIPFNPVLPPHFFECDNANLSPEEQAWRGLVFIRETPCEDMPEGAVYAVYRLDRSEGFGPTAYGAFPNRVEAQKRARAIGHALPTMDLF